MKLSEAIEALIIATKANGRSVQTVNGYARKLKPLVTFLGDADIAAITVEDLRRFIVALRDQETLWGDHPKLQARDGKLSPFTVAGHVRALKRLFNFLESEGKLDGNPARAIKTPTPHVSQPKSIDMRDLLALLQTTEDGGLADLRDRAAILMLADTGCRVRGLCGLRLEDIDLARGVALVTEKGEKPRAVCFTDITGAALQAWLEARPGDKGPFVFVSLGPKCAGGFSTGAVGEMLKRRARKAGIEGRVNPHSFRHGFAREFLLNGGDMASLCDLMGHSSIEVTKAFYAVFTMDELRAKHRRYSPVTNILGGQKNDGHNSS